MDGPTRSRLKAASLLLKQPPFARDLSSSEVLGNQLAYETEINIQNDFLIGHHCRPGDGRSEESKLGSQREHHRVA
jgi:hypothetical protein